MVHQCQRCGLDCHYRSHLIKHLSRTHSCQPMLSNATATELLQRVPSDFDKKFICNNCGKGFSSRQSRHFHKQSCSQQIKPGTLTNSFDFKSEEVEQLESITPNHHSFISHTTSLNSKLADLQAKVEKLESKIDDRKSKNSNLVSPEILLELQYYKNRKNENFYQLLLEQYLGGTHKTLPCGITDISTDDCHAEIKEWKSWKEAIGQLTCYNSVDPRPFLAMYMFGKYSDSAKQRSINVAKNCGFAIYEFKESEDGAIYVEDCTTNERKYTYKPTFNLE